MDKERLPRWGWLLIGLFVAAVTANLLNLAVFEPAGLHQDYQVITIITAMAPVLIYVGVWYDEERQHYWEHSRQHVVGDLLFVLGGAALGSGIALAVIVDSGRGQFLQDVVAMAAGFVFSWGLFWWRNPEVYRDDDDGR